MPFEHDVFISYPHLSNKDDESGQNGWVARFHRDLKSHLDEMLGRDARVWRDNKMPFGTVFSEAIGERLGKTKVLLCVLSPAYMKSDWCLRELHEFRRLAPQSGGIAVNQQSRIITIVKTPTAEQPEGMTDAIFCEFYETSEDKGGVPLPYGQTPDGHKHQEYQRKMLEIAWAIKRTVETLGDDPSPDLMRTIYLAETSVDRNEDRTKIKDELEDRKFIVLPAGPLPKTTAEEYVAAVSENLSRAFMSIHLFGERYGTVPDGAEVSIVETQNEMGAARSDHDELFKRVIWIAPNVGNAQVSQAAFLTKVRTDEQALRGAEMLERPFEDLKTRILQILDKEPIKPKENNLVKIYLMCDKRDRDSIGPVGRYLFEKGYDVIPPPEAKKNLRVLKHHKDSLRGCDAALTIYGNVEYEWVHERYDDVNSKSKGWGREGAISCSAILRTDPVTPHKDLLFLHATKVLSPCYDGLTSKTLEKPMNEFISELEKTLAE